MQLDDTTLGDEGRGSGDWLSAEGLSRWRSEIRAFLAETRQELQELARLAGAPEEAKRSAGMPAVADLRPARTSQHATETLDRLEMLKRHLAQRIRQRPVSALGETRDGVPEGPLADPSHATEDGGNHGP